MVHEDNGALGELFIPIRFGSMQNDLDLAQLFQQKLETAHKVNRSSKLAGLDQKRRVGTYHGEAEPDVERKVAEDMKQTSVDKHQRYVRKEHEERAKRARTVHDQQRADGMNWPSLAGFFLAFATATTTIATISLH